MSSIYRNGRLYGGSESHLDGLDDVTITSPAEGDLLQYDATEQKWVNSAKIPQKVAGLQKTGCVNRYNNTLISQVIDNVTVTVSADKTVTINSDGTITNDIDIALGSGTYFETGDYKLVGCPAGGSTTTYRIRLTTSYITPIGVNDVGDGVTFTVNTAGVLAPKIELKAGNTFTNLVFKPMITDDLSATYADYAPYSMTNRELTEVVSGGYLYEKYDYIAVLGNGAKTVNSLLKEVIDALNAYIGSITDRCIEISKCEVQGIINAPTQESRIYTASVNTLVFGKSSIEIASGKLETATIRCDTTETNCYATSYKFDTTPSTTKSQYGQNVLANGNYVRLYYKQYKKIV